MTGGAEPLRDPHQVIDLMVPAAGDEQDLSSLLNDLQGATCLTESWEMTLILQGRGRDIIRQVSTAVPQELLLPRGIQQPFLTPTDVRRPAVGAEHVDMERRPKANTQKLLQLFLLLFIILPLLGVNF